jgi:hypothetical protein
VYNALLNKICLEELRAHVAGKKVLLVGNAATLFSDPTHGELIDSYDIVLRFGKGVPYTKYKQYLGSKKDIWFFGTARAGMYKHFTSSKFRVLTMSQINMYKDNESSLLLNKCMFDGSLQVYRDFMIAGDLNYTKQVVVDVAGGFNKDIRISQGAQAVHFFDKVIQSQSGIDLVGFDFFEHEFIYDYPVAPGSRIPKSHSIGAWHCPITAPGFVQNPHLAFNEKAYYDTVKNLSIHKMPDFIDTEVMGRVLKELRGESANITGTN